MTFSNLKKNRTNNLDKYDSYIKSFDSKGEQEDKSQYWTLSVDPKTKEGEAIIHFLPASDGEDVPFVRYYHHAFKGPTGRWYMEQSRTTLGPKEKDPVGEANSRLWNEGGEEGKKIVQGFGDNPGRKRKLTYVSNILVVDDPRNPENNGKVFKFKYGQKIFEKIQEVLYPKRARDPKFDPFDFWEGANFILDRRMVAGYPNYDKSKFETPGPLVDANGEPLNDKALEAIWKQQHKLQDEIKVKSYDELKSLFESVVGTSTTPARDARAAGRTASAPALKEETPPWEEQTAAETGDGEEDDLSFFSRMARS